LTLFVPSISLALSSSVTPNKGICPNATWAQNGQTVAGGNGSGSGFSQLNGPFGLFVDENQTIYVADRYNDRIMKWKRGASSGQLVAGGKRQGTRDDQLYYPIDVVVDQNETMYICDYNNRRVQKWSRDAQSGQTIIRNIAAFGIARDNEGSLYVSDWSENIVKKWRVGETIGKVIISELNRPCLLFVNFNQSVIVADQWNNRIIQVNIGSTQSSIVAGIGSSGRDKNQLNLPLSVTVDHLATSGDVIIGGRGEGSRSDQFSEPTDLSFDSDGNLYVVDSGNDRILKYPIDNK
ncbi:unnamed protein product, partial [Rotaria sp. Silwood2]